MRKNGRFFIFLLLLAACFAALCGCSDPAADPTRVATVLLDKNEAYVASYGENNTYQIYPTVYPETAKNKKVIFQLDSIRDAEYVSVSDGGLVEGLKPKEGGPVRIIVKSVDNPKATATLSVYIEDKPVEHIYFDPAEKTVRIDSEPFTVGARYYPAHAAEGTTLSYSSNNAAVAEVDATTGLVTLKTRGTACIAATNPSGVTGYLTLKVLMTPPSYRLEETPSSEQSYNQTPGSPERITYTLVPGFRNDPDCRVRWFAESKEVVSNADKLTFEYLPSAGLLPQIYHVRVEIKDSDDQTQTLFSKDINVYYAFEDTDGISLDATKEYYVSDRIDAVPLLKEDQRRPEEFLWFARTLNGTETESELNDYLNYKQVGTSKYGENRGAYSFTPNEAGEVVLAMVPVVGGVRRYDKLKRTEPFTVRLLETGNPYREVRFAAVREGDNTLLGIEWDFMPGETTFVIEIDKGDGSRTFFKSAESPAYFTERGATFPADVLSFGTPATLRLRTGRYGFGGEYRYTPGSVEADAKLLAYGKKPDGLPFTYLAKSVADVGDVLNYIRFFRPGQGGYAGQTEGIAYSKVADRDGYVNAFEFEIAFGFDFSDVDPSGYDKTKPPFNKMSASYVTDSDLPSGADADATRQFGYFKADYNEIVDKVFSAFLAYGESGSARLTIVPEYFGTVGKTLKLGTKGTFSMPSSENQTHAARVSLYLKDEPPKENLASSGEKRKEKFVGNYRELKSSEPRGDAYDDYFKDNLGEMTVWNGQQLYLVAAWGYRPVPAAGSAADAILTEAKRILNSILGADVVSAADRARAIHDYLVVHVDYDYDLASNQDADPLSYGFTLEGVFLLSDPYAVCDGLSKAFALMAWMEGMPAYKISGLALPSGVGHAWNKVLIDGEWKLVDITWDATYTPPESPNVNMPASAYFLKTDKDSGFLEGVDRRTYGEYPEAK